MNEQINILILFFFLNVTCHDYLNARENRLAERGLSTLHTH